MSLYRDINNNGFTDMPMYKMYIEEMENKLLTTLSSCNSKLEEYVKTIDTELDTLYDYFCKDVEKSLEILDKITETSKLLIKNINDQIKYINSVFNQKPSKKYTEHIANLISIREKEQKNQMKYLKIIHSLNAI